MRNKIVPTAYILLNVKVNSETEVVNKIKETIEKEHQPVEYEIMEVYGVYDIVLKIISESMDGLRDLLAKIRRVEQIQVTITMLVIEEQEM
jgi:DNA-binding Lrp family transcriptional regulator